ncbi:MAG: GNAT family N-acetyltransferase [Planctomycetota bacterium]
MADIYIRPLRRSDCDKIGPLLRDIWLDAYHGIQTDTELLAQSHKVHAPELIASEIGNPNMHSVVAVTHGRIIGHARSDLSENRIDISRLYVLRAFYRRGVGKALLQEVENHFDGQLDVWLEVYEENKRAIAFYLSQGYEIMERGTEVQTEGRDVFEFKMRKQRQEQPIT